MRIYFITYLKLLWKDVFGLEFIYFISDFLLHNRLLYKRILLLKKVE